MAISVLSAASRSREIRKMLLPSRSLSLSLYSSPSRSKTRARARSRARASNQSMAAIHSTPMRLGSVPLPSLRRRSAPLPLRASVISSAPKARFAARRSESISVQQLQRPLAEYMSLPASQYSVLDAERIERVDDNTFRCYVYRFKFFAFEVCPVLVVRVEVEPFGCCIRLLSCKLEGSPIVASQNDKFSASMVNRISCNKGLQDSALQRLTTDTTIEVIIEIPFAFRAIPVEVIESTGTQVLDQLLRIMLPRFLKQLVKDYQAWASGDASRQPLGTGEI